MRSSTQQLHTVENTRKAGQNASPERFVVQTADSSEPKSTEGVSAQMNPLQLFKLNLLEYERHSRMLRQFLNMKSAHLNSDFLERFQAARDMLAVNDEEFVKTIVKKSYRESKLANALTSKLERSRHGVVCDGENLFKLGQIDID
jgi:uncharacterized membrane protein YccC